MIAKEYKKYLEDNKKVFGITGDISKLKKPVLVRIIPEDITREEAQKLITDLNAGSQYEVRDAYKGISKAKFISDKTFTLLENEFKKDPQTTLRKILDGKTGQDILESLINDGAIDQSEVANLTNKYTGELSTKGKDKIEAILRGVVIDDYDLLDMLPGSVKNKIDAILPALFKLRSGKGWDLIPSFQKTLNAYAKFVSLQKKEATNQSLFDAFLRQKSLFGDKIEIDAHTKALAHILMDPKIGVRKIRKIVNSYAAARQNELIPTTPDKAFKDVFGTEKLKEGGVVYEIHKNQPVLQDKRKTPVSGRGAAKVRRSLFSFVSSEKPQVVHNTIGTFKGPKKISSPDDIATILSPLAVKAQENVVALVLDKYNQPIAVHLHTIGVNNASAIDPGVLVGAVLNTDGAASVVFAHNHPSGDINASPQDKAAFDKLARLLDGTGIKLKDSYILSGDGRYSTFKSDGTLTGIGNIKKGEGKKSIPVKERIFSSYITLYDWEKELSAPEKVIDYLKKNDLLNKSGILFVNNKNIPVKFVPVLKPEKLKAGDSIKLARAIDRYNVRNAFVVLPDNAPPEHANNLIRYLNAAGITPLDVLFGAKAHSREFFNVDIRDQGPFYSRSQTSSRSTVKEVESWIEPLRKVLKNLPDLEVVQSESELPKEVYEDIQAKKAEGEIQGVWWDKIYLVANNISSFKEATKALLHEAVGHYGLRSVLGNKYKQFMNQAWLNRKVREQAKALAKEYGLNLTNQRDRWIATEEALAHMAQEGVKVKPLDNIRAFIRQLWRKVVLAYKQAFGKRISASDMELSDAEINQMLARAARFVEGGETAEKSSAILYKRTTELHNHPEDFLFDQKKVPQEVQFTFHDEDKKLLASFAKPHFLAKEWKHFGRVYQRERQRVKDRQKLFRQLLEQLDTFLDLSKDEEAVVAKIVWGLEGKKIKGLPDKYIEKNGNLVLNPEHYAALRKFLGKYRKQIEDAGFDADRIINAYIETRKVLDHVHVDSLNTLQSLKDWVEPETIAEHRKSLGLIENYFPHHRYGKYYIQGTKNGEVVYRQHFDISFELLKKPLSKQKKYIKRAAMKIVESLKREYPDVEWRVGENTKMPEEVFEYPIPVDAMEQILNAAADRAKAVDEKLADGIKEIMPKAVADVLKLRGFGSHFVQRKSIPGYEMNDIKKVLYDYLAGYSGWRTKMTASRDFMGILRDIKASAKPNEYAYSANFIRDMLRNADNIDRLVTKMKGVAFFWYLGNMVSTGVLNLTQNIQVGIPRLGMEVKGSALKWLRGASDTIVSAITKGRALPSEERRLIHDLFLEGVTTANYLDEIRGKMSSAGFGKIFNQVTKWAGLTMEISERFNRISLALAAFRAARQGQVTNQETLARFKKKPGEKFTFDEAKKFAEEIVEDSHFVFERANTPEFLRSSKGGRLLSAAYTFRTFTHNQLALWKWMLKNGDVGRKAFAKSLFAIFLLAGYKCLPFYKSLACLYKELFGSDEEPVDKFVKHITAKNSWVRDAVTYGLPALSGITLQSSLAIEAPGQDSIRPPENLAEGVDRALIDALGIPYDLLVSKPSRTISALKSGKIERALEYLLPRFISSILRTYREATEGVVTLSGRKVLDFTGDKIKPLKPEGAEIPLQFLGFTTIRKAKNRDIQRDLEFARSLRQEKLREFADRLIDAMRNKERAKSKEVFKEIKLWNKKAIKEKKPYLVITKDSIKAALRSRKRPVLSTRFDRLWLQNHQ